MASTVVVGPAGTHARIDDLEVVEAGIVMVLVSNYSKATDIWDFAGYHEGVVVVRSSAATPVDLHQALEVVLAVMEHGYSSQVSSQDAPLAFL